MKLPDVGFLVQGTLYSDVIESGGGDRRRRRSSRTTTSAACPRTSSSSSSSRCGCSSRTRSAPSPPSSACPTGWSGASRSRAPASAIRIVGGEVNEERLEILREADAILQEEVRAAGLYRELWQSFCVLPVVRSVGVQGDGRTYAYPIVIRAVTSDDAMTADWARLPYDLLERVSNRIINEVAGVNRVALDISVEAPGNDRVGIGPAARGAPARRRFTRNGPGLGSYTTPITPIERRLGPATGSALPSPTPPFRSCPSP